MKRFLLPAGVACLLTAPALAAPLETTVVATPPNPVVGEPLSVLVTRASETEVELSISVQINPGPPGTPPGPPDTSPGPPTIEIVHP
jgi:hypothetical protein